MTGLWAGVLVLAGLAFGVPCSPLNVNIWWPDLAAFIVARLRAFAAPKE
jgi:hypothetical protein